MISELKDDEIMTFSEAMLEIEKQKLLEIAAKAKSKDYILRFWNTPNRTSEQRNDVWTVLNDAGVGLIGADELKELQQFFTTKN